MDFSEKDSVDAVLASFADTPDPRLHEVIEGLVLAKHGIKRTPNATPATSNGADEKAAAVAKKVASPPAKPAN